MNEGANRLPNYEQCELACDMGRPTAMQRFIYENTPANAQEEAVFRTQLAAALNEFATPSAGRVEAVGRSQTVTVDYRTAQLVRRVFLPLNPNKMRNATPEVVQAAKDFIAAYDAAAPSQPARPGANKE